MSASAVAPLLRYRDPNKAADWLCRAFGFKIDKVEREPDGSLRFISLNAGYSSILVGPADGTQLDQWLVQPDDIGGFGTQTCYLHVDDIKSHYANAEAAGARIEMEPILDEDGSAYYLCRDPEGHLWSFGTHSFTREQPAPPAAPAPPMPVPESGTRRKRSPIGILAGVVALLIGGSLLVYASTDFGVAPGSNAPAAGGGGHVQVRTKAFALLVERSKKEREKRIAAEEAAKDADVRHKEALAIGDELRNALNEARSALQSAQQQKAKAESELRTLEVAAEKELSRKQVELDKAKREVASLQNTSAAEMVTVKEELEQAKRKLGELKATNAAEVSSTKEELKQARQKVEELTQARQKVEELEAAKTEEMSSTRQELERAKLRVKELEAAKTAEVNSTREELARAKRKVDELEAAKSKVMNSAKEQLKLAKRKVADLVAAKSVAMKSAKAELNQARQKVAALETAKASATASAHTAAKKLKSANELNRALQEKLDEASNSVLTVRRKNAELEKALVDIREKYETKVEENHRKLSFASPEFAKVTQKLEAERKRARVAEAALAKTSKELEQTRTEAKRLALKVQSLQTELKNSYSNVRLRFSALQLHDAEVAVLSQPKTAWAPVVRPTANPERKSKTIVKRRHIAASNTASSRKAKKSEARLKKDLKKVLKKDQKKDRKKERKKLAALTKKKREEKSVSRTPGEVASACARALWSSTLKRGGWTKSSKLGIIRRLCSHNPSSAEPAKCFNMLMAGQVNWGAGSKWSSQHAIRLCAGTPSASTTIGCFRSSVANMGWRDAILQCT